MGIKHTPGPWMVIDQRHVPWTDALTIATDPDANQAIAYTTRGFEGGRLPSGEHDERACAWANARLIAAAPELLVACTEAASRLHYSGDLFHDQGNETRAKADWAAAEICRAAVCKATGTEKIGSGLK